jgi:Fe-S oxidoreductase
MAKMKIEVLYQRQRVQGVALRDRVIAHLPRLAPYASRIPALANLRNRVGWLARHGERRHGIAAKRTLPSWRRDTFLRATSISAPTPDVVLFVDTFTNYFEPANAHAALAVLNAAGYRTAVARAGAIDGGSRRPLCCGRTYLAAGMVDEARVEARRMIAALAPHAAAGAAIVGLEPACLLSLRDEYAVLGLGEAAKTVGERALLIEEFLAREADAGRLKLPLKPLPQSRALLHGHCHQKAFGAMDATRRALSLVPNLAVDVVESSCCGMAGSFGYDAAHYDVSMKMAELSLLPAVRAASADTLIVADGTSCRHQIADGTRASGAREAMHVVRVLAQALQRIDAISASGS